ncbi:unnamed protein product [Gongylonema pulchrum]|uniref:IkappaB kinase n=1 Tax=Gongylonema pulchrum TaxID=637853 RepID=A0A183CY14_9BILA|nr:unnamed protein product [Gongylonema pulchrum]
MELMPPRLAEILHSVIMNTRGSRALIMELADSNVGDELHKLENFFGLPYLMLIRLISHLVQGLSYLNSEKIAHRDLKPENILIFNQPDGMKFKLCDFGGSRIVTDNCQPLHSICGTPGYLNVNITANLAHNTKALPYTKDECDLWSVGITLFKCATGVLPFIPANGCADTVGMHSMMINRPADAICGHVSEDGRFVWEKDFPKGRCLYPRTFRRVLREFFRRLFDKREATRLTFETFAAMCEELIGLRRIPVFKTNIMLFEDYFDTSHVKLFENALAALVAELCAVDFCCHWTIS